MASADFTIQGQVTPPEVAVAYGATVTLALVSTSGSPSISWSIVGSSAASLAIPTITPAGSPLGATATFAMPADPGGGLGISFIVQCKLNGGKDSAGQADSSLIKTALVGVANDQGIVPTSVGEKSERSPTHGWTEAINVALNRQDGTPGAPGPAGAGRTAVKYKQTATLPANTYAAGVITATANGALATTIFDGATPGLNEPVLVDSLGVSATINGIFTLTQAGDGSHPWKLTRRSDADSTGDFTSGCEVTVSSGSLFAGTSWYMTNDPAAVVLDTTALAFAQRRSRSGLVIDLTAPPYNIAGQTKAAVTTATPVGTVINQAIHDAIATVDSTYGATLLLPQGFVRIDQPIQMQRNITLQGYGSQNSGIYSSFLGGSAVLITNNPQAADPCDVAAGTSAVKASAPANTTLIDTNGSISHSLRFRANPAIAYQWWMDLSVAGLVFDSWAAFNCEFIGQFLAFAQGSPSLTFSGHTITRATGSWIADGAVVGTTVTITGSASNNVTGTVTAVTATVLTCAATTFVAEGPTSAPTVEFPPFGGHVISCQGRDTIFTAQTVCFAARVLSKSSVEGVLRIGSTLRTITLTGLTLDATYKYHYCLTYDGATMRLAFTKVGTTARTTAGNTLDGSSKTVAAYGEITSLTGTITQNNWEKSHFGYGFGYAGWQLAEYPTTGLVSSFNLAAAAQTSRVSGGAAVAFTAPSTLTTPTTSKLTWRAFDSNLPTVYGSDVPQAYKLTNATGSVWAPILLEAQNDGASGAGLVGLKITSLNSARRGVGVLSAGCPGLTFDDVEVDAYTQPVIFGPNSFFSNVIDLTVNANSGIHSAALSLFSPGGPFGIHNLLAQASDNGYGIWGESGSGISQTGKCYITCSASTTPFRYAHLDGDAGNWSSINVNDEGAAGVSDCGLLIIPPSNATCDLRGTISMNSQATPPIKYPASLTSNGFPRGRWTFAGNLLGKSGIAQYVDTAGSSTVPPTYWGAVSITGPDVPLCDQANIVILRDSTQAKGANLTDAAQNLKITEGSWRHLPAGTLTAARAKTFILPVVADILPAEATGRDVLVSWDAQAFDFTIVNKAAGPTIFTGKAGTAGSARVLFDGTNFAIRGSPAFVPPLSGRVALTAQSGNIAAQALLTAPPPDLYSVGGAIEVTTRPTTGLLEIIVRYTDATGATSQTTGTIDVNSSTGKKSISLDTFLIPVASGNVTVEVAATSVTGTLAYNLRARAQLQVESF